MTKKWKYNSDDDKAIPMTKEERKEECKQELEKLDNLKEIRNKLLLEKELEKQSNLFVQTILDDVKMGRYTFKEALDTFPEYEKVLKERYDGKNKEG